MRKTANAVNWFEIPVKDLDRARDFYETIFDSQLEEPTEMLGMKMVSFPYEPANGKVSGALVQSEMHEPSQTGAVVYLNANPSIQEVIDRIEEAGGTVVLPRTEISPEVGYMAFFIDTEGNKVGLHSQN